MHSSRNTDRQITARQSGRMCWMICALAVTLSCLLWDTLRGQQPGNQPVSLISQYLSRQEKSTDAKDTGTIQQPEEPLDRWQGSSLGFTLIGFAPGHFMVEKVRSGLAASVAGLQAEDKLLEVGPVDLLTQSKSDLKSYLEQLAPNSTIKVVVKRQVESNGKQVEKRIDLRLVTDSKAMLDGWIVADRLQNNRIIRQSLDERKQLEKLENLSENILRDIKKAATPRQAYERLNHRIDELGVSHTAIIPAWGYQRLTNQAKGGIGLTLQRQTRAGKSQYFVIDMEPGGPAHTSVMTIGDQVLSVNEIALEKSARLILAGEEQHQQLFMIASEKDETLQLAIRKKEKGPTQTVLLKTDINLSANSASKSSLRVIKHDGKKFGYYRIWNLMSMKVDAYLSRAIEEEFKDCDGLIIDMRGRGGSIPVVQRIEKTILGAELPVVGIIDKHSRSAKEILAIRLKGNDNVLLLGQRTCGAVTAATFAKLPSGNALMFPVSSGQRLSRYTRNINLEGKGVAPDIEVQFDLPFIGGKDPLLAAGKNQLLKMLGPDTEN